MEPTEVELEAGRQFETARHLARAERRHVRLVVDFYPDGRVTSATWIKPGQVRAAAHDVRPLNRRPRPET